MFASLAGVSQDPQELAEYSRAPPSGAATQLKKKMLLYQRCSITKIEMQNGYENQWYIGDS
jgi:hypothetical protein